jgi:gamma-glutamylcyclotransferase (GGCT)/AIG2-like uncharacterized protein YtfP
MYYDKRRPFVAYNDTPKVAVYGTLRKGGGLHRAIAEQEFIGQGRVHGAIMYSLGACPGIRLDPEKQEKSVVVEVYAVDRDLLIEHLDRIEAMYSRVEVPVELDDGRFMRAWIYEIEEDFGWGGVEVESGDWNEWEAHHDPWNDLVERRCGIGIVRGMLADNDDPEVILVDAQGFPVIEGESVCWKDGNPVDAQGRPVRLVCIDDIESEGDVVSLDDLLDAIEDEDETVDLDHDESDGDLPRSISDMTDEEFGRLYGQS